MDASTFIRPEGVSKAGADLPTEVGIAGRCRADERQPLFGMTYEPSPDGQKFLVRERVSPDTTISLTVVVNWPELLKSNK